MQFMMQRALADVGLDWRCLTLEVLSDDLQDAVRGIRALGFRGASLDLPHRVAAIPFLDQLSESAELIGAVNCIYRVENKLAGENTDGQAFVHSLSDVGVLDAQRVLLLGAGGTARAIAVELGRAGVAEICVSNRSAERAEVLVELLNSRLSVAARVIPWHDPIAIGEDVDIVINATSLGHLDPDAEIPLDTDTLTPSMTVADVIVNPPHTWLIREAADRGCTVLDGLDMFVKQGVLNFKLWSGCDPDPAVMREALEEFLEV